MGRKLYRYRSFNTEFINEYSHIHKSILNIEKWKLEAFEGLVFPSSPLYFNDPYDCDFCFQPEGLECAIDRSTYIHILEERFHLKREDKNRLLYSADIERAIGIVLQSHGEKLSTSWKTILRNGLNDSIEEIKDTIRVVCLSESYNSMLMWSHYAQNHKGFCIEYSFEETDVIYKHLYPVVYTKNRYAISKEDMMGENTEWIYRSTCRKSDVWSYEQEWRIVTANFNRVIPQKLEYPDGKYMLDLKNNITAFYLGAKAHKNLKKEIIDFSKRENLSVYQMVLSPDTYDLKVEKIT